VPLGTQANLLLRKPRQSVALIAWRWNLTPLFFIHPLYQKTAHQISWINTEDAWQTVRAIRKIGCKGELASVTSMNLIGKGLIWNCLSHILDRKHPKLNCGWLLLIGKKITRLKTSKIIFSICLRLGLMITQPSQTIFFNHCSLIFANLETNFAKRAANQILKSYRQIWRVVQKWYRRSVDRYQTFMNIA
jgi:hypothetical protein